MSQWVELVYRVGAIQAARHQNADCAVTLRSTRDTRLPVDWESVMRGVAMGVAAAGVAVLLWHATPIWWDGLVESGAEGPVSGMAFVALMFGTAAGVLAGLLDNRRTRAGLESAGPSAVIAFVAVSLFALWPFGVLVSMFPRSDQAPTSSSRVFEACAVWLVYVALAYLLYWIVTGRARRRAR
jgi:hypothetical protein